jgi:hypothetical protein
MICIHFQLPLPAYTFIMKLDHGWHLVLQSQDLLFREKRHPWKYLDKQCYKFGP